VPCQSGVRKRKAGCPAFRSADQARIFNALAALESLLAAAVPVEADDALLLLLDDDAEAASVWW